MQVKESLIDDVIIPNLRNLKLRPESSIIIQIIKDELDLNKISQLEFLQPNHRNIWLISTRSLSTKYTTYCVLPNIPNYISN
jgi:hypothetical protein